MHFLRAHIHAVAPRRGIGLMKSPACEIDATVRVHVYTWIGIPLSSSDRYTRINSAGGWKDEGFSSRLIGDARTVLLES